MSGLPWKATPRRCISITLLFNKQHNNTTKLSSRSKVPSIIFLVLSANAIFSSWFTYSRLFRAAAGFEEATFRRRLAITLAATAAALWTAAFATFSARNYDTAESPEESRQLGSRCQFLGFYDWHDMWHLLSAAAALVSLAAVAAADEAFEPVERKKLADAFTE